MSAKFFGKPPRLPKRNMREPVLKGLSRRVEYKHEGFCYRSRAKFFTAKPMSVLVFETATDVVLVVGETFCSA